MLVASIVAVGIIVTVALGGPNSDLPPEKQLLGDSEQARLEAALKQPTADKSAFVVVPTPCPQALQLGLQAWEDRGIPLSSSSASLQRRSARLFSLLGIWRILTKVN